MGGIHVLSVQRAVLDWNSVGRQTFFRAMNRLFHLFDYEHRSPSSGPPPSLPPHWEKTVPVSETGYTSAPYNIMCPHRAPFRFALEFLCLCMCVCVCMHVYACVYVYMYNLMLLLLWIGVSKIIRHADPRAWRVPYYPLTFHSDYRILRRRNSQLVNLVICDETLDKIFLKFQWNSRKNLVHY